MLEKYIKAALKETECDVLLKNGSYVDLFSGTVKEGDIAIKDDRIVGMGKGYKGKDEYDIKGMTVIPGLIDGHVHIESSQSTPEEFASMIVPHGTTTIIADPHELANILGMNGVHYVIEASKNVPLDVKVQLSSCVPATPFETSGAILNGQDIADNIGDKDINGLGEFMAYPSVIGCDPDTLKKLEATHAADKVIDGHAPLLRGDELNGYLCGGIMTDHESGSVEEMQEKISKGIYTHLRIGSYTRSMELVKAINSWNYRRVILCTDDKHAVEIKKNGHLDDALRRVTKAGLDPIIAVAIATLNNAECYRLRYRGAIAPFYFADLVVMDNLQDFNAKLVFKDGKLVAKDGKPLFDTSKKYLPDFVKNTVHVKDFTADDFKIEIKSKKARIMTTESSGVMTGEAIMEVESKDGDVVVEGTDLLKMIVIERHKMTGNIGKALIKGYGFKGGAMGISVAHDSHNIILLGDDNESLLKATNELRRIGGGMVIVDKKNDTVESVQLDIAGLMSSKPSEVLQEESQHLINKAYSMGVDRNKEAFFSLTFLSLAVIPHLRLVDKGLFDVFKFDFVPLEAE